MSFEDLVWLFTSNKESRGIVRLNLAEGALLYKYCKLVRDGTLLEVGRKHGGSTVLMANALRDGHLYSIDIVMHECVNAYVSDYDYKITFLTDDSKKIEWDAPIDLVFIDGDHSYQGVKNDIKKFTPYVEKGGYAIFHDVVGKKGILQPLIDGLLKKGWIEAARADSLLVLKNES
jgi:predicted O-methyltransferase YrrM